MITSMDSSRRTSLKVKPFSLWPAVSAVTPCQSRFAYVAVVLLVLFVLDCGVCRGARFGTGCARTPFFSVFMLEPEYVETKTSPKALEHHRDVDMSSTDRRAVPPCNRLAPTPLNDRLPRCAVHPPSLLSSAFSSIRLGENRR